MPLHDEAADAILACTDPEARAFLAFLYLSAARVTEALMVTPRMLRLRPQDGLVVVRGLPVLKKRKPASRTFPLSTRSPQDRELVRAFLEHACQPGKWRRKDDRLFGFKYLAAYRRVRRWLGRDWWPHLCRHARLTHLGEERGLNAHELKDYVGWSSTRQADSYVHPSFEDIRRKLDGVAR